MPKNADRDADLLLDLRVWRSKLIQRLTADGGVCEQDVAVLRAFDTTTGEMGQRHQVRTAFESLMRNGASRWVTEQARDAGITVIVGGKDRRVADVVPLNADQFGPEAA